MSWWPEHQLTPIKWKVYFTLWAARSTLIWRWPPVTPWELSHCPVVISQVTEGLALMLSGGACWSLWERLSVWTTLTAQASRALIIQLNPDHADGARRACASERAHIWSSQTHKHTHRVRLVEDPCSFQCCPSCLWLGVTQLWAQTSRSDGKKASDSKNSSENRWSNTVANYCHWNKDISGKGHSRLRQRTHIIWDLLFFGCQILKPWKKKVTDFIFSLSGETSETANSKRTSV